MDQLLCSSCHFSISESFYFCPNCGKKIKEAPLPTTIGKQISVYALSILLPPLGLWPGIRYLLQKDQKAHMIGMVVIALTIFSTIITFWITISLVNQLSKTVSSQMNQYQNLGF